LAVPDLLVAGLGPAGRALAHRALALGLHVHVVDPHPQRQWRATYGAWADELPAWLPHAAIGAHVAAPQVWTTRRHRMMRDYVVFDTPTLQDSLDITGAETISATVEVSQHDHARLADGRMIPARVVVDARGLGATPGSAQQTAYGLVLDADAAQPALDGASALFMDWRTDNGATPGDLPSFLYAVPLNERQMLLEETCLVGRPALDLATLRTRLVTRLAARGVQLSGGEPVERVRFAVTPEHRFAGHAFGARAGLGHPGTGYSVAASLALADAVAAAVARDTDVDDVLWPASARVVQRLRLAGLRTLLAMAPEQVAPFFGAFFALPPRLQRAYLSGRTDLPGTVSAMLAVYARAPMPVRRSMTRAALGRHNAVFRS
jgi:lycopene beta-cyclase